MKYLVTGCNGYIGRHVMAAMEKAGLDYAGTDYRLDVEDEKHIKCDIFDENVNLKELFPEAEVLIHLAWRDGFNHKSDNHILDLGKHYSFISRMMDAGIKQVAVMGSMHEVGYHEGAIDENTVCAPMSKYGVGKNALREAVKLLCVERNVVFQWIRGFYLVGDNKGTPSIFGKLLDANERGQKDFPFTSGKNEYDFISIDELAYQITKTVSQNKVVGIINCCSGKPLSLKEGVEKFIKDNNLDINLVYGAYPDRPYDSPCIYGDNTKILEILKEN